MMRNNRFVLLISMIALILLALVPAVSASQIIYNEELFEYIDTSQTGLTTWDHSSGWGDRAHSTIVFKDITKAQVLDFLVFEFPIDTGKWLDGSRIQDGRYDITYNFNGADRPGVLYVNRKTDSSGTVTATQFTLSFKDWDIGDLRGQQTVTVPFYFYWDYTYLYSEVSAETNAYLPIPAYGFYSIKVTEKTGIMWKHHITVTEDQTSYHVDINGFIDGYKYTSQVQFLKDGELFASLTNPGEALHRSFLQTQINMVKLISPSGREYAFPLYVGGIPGDPDTIPIVVYAKSSQTSVLLNDARIIISDTSTVPWTEVVNKTFPTGYDVVYLQKDLGFNPTQYHITAKVPGYQPVNPGLFFRVIGPMSVVVEMEPIEGGPADEDNTFLEFYVRGANSNPISNAMVSVAGQTRWTNAQGYTQFEVPKNTGYSYTVSKSGYTTIKGSATVGDGPRYTVNVVLTPESVPTQPPGTDPTTSPVNVYVKSSQTGALLAGAQVIIKDTTTDPWREVVNQTLASGFGTFSLANDPGFDPAQYHITAILPGYEPVYPALFFRVTGPMDIVVEMEPIEGGPADENNAFLEFYVRNLDDNPVSNAMVSVAGQTRWTNAEGWTQFEVLKNASYPYTVSKSGYATIEGTATVGDGPRYVVNVVFGPKAIPTQPPGPGWPTQPPTQPPSGIPGDDGSEGFLSEAVRGISKIFGVGFATGKTILGMLLAIAIGFTTAKKLRGGAAEFGLGLLGGTMLGVLIGLLPVWTIVVLLLVVGMYIGYRYVGGGNNG